MNEDSANFIDNRVSKKSFATRVPERTLNSMMLAFILISFYFLYSIFSDNELIIVNIQFFFLITVVSYCLCSSLLYLMNNSPFSISVIFEFFWSLLFYVASFKLSYLQKEWSFFDAIYMYFVPFICSKVFAYYRYSNYQKGCFFSYNFLFKFCMFFCLLSVLCLYVMIHRLGFLPAFSDNPNLSRMSFNLPYVNVAAWCFVSALYLLSGFGWIILKKRKYLFFTGYSLAFYFVFASRSGIICLILMLVILFSLSKMTNGRLEFFSKKVVVYFSLVLFACTVLGELRMSNSHFDIVKYGSFRTNNVVLAWVYGYVFVNLDNLQLSLKHDSPYYRGVHTFQAINPFLGIHTDQTLMDEYHYIGKFNLGTGFRDYYLDWGMLGAPIVLILVWLSYILFGRLFRTDLLIVYTSYIIQQIIMFLLDDRFSSFLMIFSVCVLLFYDRFLTKRQTIMRSLSTLS